MRDMKRIFSGISIAVMGALTIIVIFGFGCNNNDQPTDALGKPGVQTEDELETAEIPPIHSYDPATIEIESMSDCLLFTDNDPAEVNSNMDCIFYVYSNGKLRLRHVNAGFNCCPEIDKAIEIRDNSIFITEIEVEGICDCSCLFEIEYTIAPLAPGTYFIHFDEPYVHQNGEVLEFTVDLVNEPTGEYCVWRDYYPWGVEYQP